MSEKLREDERASDAALTVEEEAREKQAEHDREEEESEDEATEEVREEKRKFRLASSPLDRLGIALAYAGVPLVHQLGPHVVDCEWRDDGWFTLSLNRELFFDAGGAALAFETTVTGRAGYDGLTELEGVRLDGGEAPGIIETMAAVDAGRDLVVGLAGVDGFLRVPTPPRDKGAATY